MKKTVAILFSVILLIACKEPFMPEVTPQYKNLLVVEGFINIGGVTTIQISRTGDLQDYRSILPEKGAEVTIEGDKGTKLLGLTGDDGKCIIQTQNLSLDEQYRLKVITNGKGYQTEYLESKASPQVDSLFFRIENKGFQIYLDTHDDDNRTRYYCWDYGETWEVRSPLMSSAEYKSGEVVPRDININITRCWKGQRSSQILLGTTERLSQDIITKFPVSHVPGNSEQMAFRYSILVNQYALTKEAYTYFENLKKNTEKIGTLFDPQPSELKGNLMSASNPDELVVGWISAGTVTQKRLFITDRDKPLINSDWVYREICTPFSTSADSLVYYLNGRNLIVSANPIYAIGSPVIIGWNFSMAKEKCIDCRLKGTNIKPSYWPD